MLYNVNTHQSVQPKYYPVLAKYFIKYLEEYKKHGIVVDYLSLFIKFVRPGAVRIETTGKADGVRVMAFQTPEGIVAQILNSAAEGKSSTWSSRASRCI
jgi:O-glycosyl hydrolase